MATDVKELASMFQKCAYRDLKVFQNKLNGSRTYAQIYIKMNMFRAKIAKKNRKNLEIWISIW